MKGTSIEAAFVSTNSICQGEHINALWNELLQSRCCINFAHRTFRWSNEAKNKAVVFCVIVGFSIISRKIKEIYEQHDERDELQIEKVDNIAPTLDSGLFIMVKKEPVPLCGQKDIRFGNMPRDGGYLILSAEERKALLEEDASAECYIRPYVGGKEFMNQIPSSDTAIRYCIWLKDISPAEMIKHPGIMERVKLVRSERQKSKAASTREFANIPHLFCQIAQNGNEDFIAFPAVTSARREYVPVGFLPKGTIASNKLYIILEASLFEFGILSSRMHMAWMKQVCGRMKSDYSYARDLCYNTFYWPEKISEKQKSMIESTARAVLDIRTKYNDCSLATLYNPETMPYELLQAHRKLDAAVERAYGRRFADDAERVAFLFGKYRELTEGK